MKEIQTFRKYLIEEFYDDYREGEISRRTFIRRMAFLTGSMAAAATAMTAVGCAPLELPAATEPMPTPTPPAEEEAAVTADGLMPVEGAQSPLSVPEGDPDVISVQGIDVPYAVLANEPEVTNDYATWAPAFEAATAKLWGRIGG